MTRSALSFAAALLCCSAPALAMDDSVEPGAWERKLEMVAVTANGAPLPDAMEQPSVKRICISPELAKTPASLVNPRDNANCHLDEKSNVSGGRIALIGYCEPGGEGSPPARTDVTGNGSYDRTSFTMDVVIAMQVKDQAIRIDAKGTGRHLGPCGPDDPPPGK